jgi:DNA-binding GntR family transcriptional regulator
VTEPEAAELPLGEAAFRRIRTDIVACRLAPGQRLTERGLAAELGMGVSPIREALTRLDHDGLVRTIPRKGYQVTPLTIKSVDELFDFWALIGPELVRRGVAAIDDHQIERAIGYGKDITGLRLTHDRGPTRSVALRGVEAAGRLFDLLAEAADNRYLISAHRRVIGEVLRVWTLVIDSELADTGRRVAALADIRDAMVRRDAEGAAELMRQHIEQSHHRVLRTLARWPSVVTSEVLPVSAVSP